MTPSAWAVGVVGFDPGEGADFGAADLPDVVLGPPAGGGATTGGTDVVSLGAGGVIVVELGTPVVDGYGPDLFVFENPFVVAGGTQVFGEPGEVAVSADGRRWSTFPCAPEKPPPNGCAGYGLVRSDEDAQTPASAGGDAFDLATLAEDPGEVRFVRITDVAGGGFPPSVGFDLDAVGVARP